MGEFWGVERWDGEEEVVAGEGWLEGLRGRTTVSKRSARPR